MPADVPRSELPSALRGFDALGLGRPRDALVDLLVVYEESTPHEHATLRRLEHGLYAVGSRSERHHLARRGSYAHWYGFVPNEGLVLASLERLLGARPARIRERVRRALYAADRGPLDVSLRPGVYRDAVVVASALMSLGEAERASAFLERLGERDADVVWVTPPDEDGLRPIRRRSVYATFRRAMQTFAADREMEAARLAADVRTRLKRGLRSPADALLDAHAAMLAAAALAETADLERASEDAEAAWRALFEEPELRHDLRVGIDFIASGILHVASSRGLVITGPHPFVLPASEPEWVRGLAVAERGTSARCPHCDAGLASFAFPEPPWPKPGKWITSSGPLDAGGVRYRRVPNLPHADPRFVVSVLSPPAKWARCPECTAVLLPFAFLDDSDRAIWQVDSALSWSDAASCAWAPVRCFVDDWPAPTSPIEAAILEWVLQDLRR